MSGYNYQTGRYTSTQSCEYCGEPFEASRRDAKFCDTACRVANHRREKQREEAAASMAGDWSADTLAAYQSLSQQYPAAVPTILDLYGDQGQAAAEAAVLLAVEVAGKCEAAWAKRLNQAHDVARRYEEECRVLEEVRRLVR